MKENLRVNSKENLKGKLEGKLEQARVAVINLLKNNILSVDEVARVLETPVDFVLNIQKELKKNPNLKK